MPISEIEQEFTKAGSTWIPKIHKYLESPPSKTSSSFEESFVKNLYGFPTCLVGEMRDKLGLPKGYYWHSEINPRDYCFYCKFYAGNIYVSVLEEHDQPEYLVILQRLKQHLKEAHNKEI